MSNCDNCGDIELWIRDYPQGDPWPQRYDEVEVTVVRDSGQLDHSEARFCDLCVVGAARRGVIELNGKTCMGYPDMGALYPTRVRFK